jgi:hypothetical protein
MAKIKTSKNDKFDPSNRFPVKPFKCTICGKTVKLPTWGKKRKYCSMTCSQAAVKARLEAERPKKRPRSIFDY